MGDSLKMDFERVEMRDRWFVFLIFCSVRTTQCVGFNCSVCVGFLLGFFNSVYMPICSSACGNNGVWAFVVHLYIVLRRTPESRAPWSGSW